LSTGPATGLQTRRQSAIAKKASAIDPSDTAILRLFGWDWLKSGKVSEAVCYFTHAVQLNSRLHDARLA
jgi:hypothetical protein